MSPGHGRRRLYVRRDGREHPLENPESARIPGLLYRPYTCQGLSLLFRDREISDLVSFEYWRWRRRTLSPTSLPNLRKKGRGAR